MARHRHNHAGGADVDGFAVVAPFHANTSAYNNAAIPLLARQPYGQTVPSVGVWDVIQDVVDGMPCRRGCRRGRRRRGHLARQTDDIDYLNGNIVRRGKALGINTPAKQGLWAMMKSIEAKAS